MQFKLLTSLLFILVIAFSIYLIREYLIYLNLYTVKPPSNRLELRHLNMQRQVQKHKVSNLSVVMLLLILFVLGFLLFNLASVKTDTDNLKKEQTIEKKKATTSSEKLNLNKNNAIVSYQDNDWKINSYKWRELLNNKGSRLLEHETALAQYLTPFLGENSLSIKRGTDLTIAIFSVGLTDELYQKAQKNVSTIVGDANKVPEIALLDFTFAYYDEAGSYQKNHQLFYQQDGLLKELIEK